MLLYSLLYNYLFIIFKENATFKLHFVLIVLPCKQQNVTYIGFLNYMHLPLKSHIKIRTQLIKVILCTSEQICSIVRYCFRSFKQL